MQRLHGIDHSGSKYSITIGGSSHAMDMLAGRLTPLASKTSLFGCLAHREKLWLGVGRRS